MQLLKTAAFQDPKFKGTNDNGREEEKREKQRREKKTRSAPNTTVICQGDILRSTDCVSVMHRNPEIKVFLRMDL